MTRKDSNHTTKARFSHQILIYRQTFVRCLYVDLLQVTRLKLAKESENSSGEMKHSDPVSSSDSVTWTFAFDAKFSIEVQLHKKSAIRYEVSELLG